MHSFSPVSSTWRKLRFRLLLWNRDQDPDMHHVPHRPPSPKINHPIQILGRDSSEEGLLDSAYACKNLSEVVKRWI